MVWEIVFMLLILKIPIVYLCVVVWYAIREEPAPADPAAPVRVTDTPPSGGSPYRSRRGAVRLPRRPSPTRRPHGPQRTALRAGARR
jgi:hypothetical protein